MTEVLGIGGHEKQFHVIVHPEELQRFDLTLADVIDRVHANNLNVGAQFIEKNSEEFVVRSVGLATSADDLRSVVIKTEEGPPPFPSRRGRRGDRGRGPDAACRPERHRRGRGRAWW